MLKFLKKETNFINFLIKKNPFFCKNFYDNIRENNYCDFVGPVFFDNVCRRYGNVILSLKEDMLPWLEEFYLWVSENAQRWALAKEPMLPISWWNSLFQNFLYESIKHRSHYPEEAKNILTLLYERGRLRHLPSIIQYIKEERSLKRKVYIYCNQKNFRKEEEKELLDILEPLLDKPGEIEIVQDPQVLLGGVILWNHWMIDCSLSTSMCHIK